MHSEIRHMGIASINPATGEALRRFEPDSTAEIDRKLQLAGDTFLIHRRSEFSQRSQWMLRAAEILESDKAEFARTMALEMGKPIRAAVQEVEKCALACRFYAEHAAG